MQEAYVTNQSLRTNYNSHIKKGGTVYFYQDKSDKIYELGIKDIEIEGEDIKLILDGRMLMDNMNGYIDIPMRSKSILQQIITGGGNGV